MRKSGITDQQLLEHARKFSTMAEWMKSCSDLRPTIGCCMASLTYKRGKDFYAKCTAHLARRPRSSRLNHAPYKLKAKWRALTKDEILASARQYDGVNRWLAGAGHGYIAAAKNFGPEFYASCTAHMTHCVPEDFPHVVYVATYSDGAAYVGYTSDFESRKWKHEHGGPVTGHSEIAGPITWLILERGIPGAAKAKKQEKRWIALYKSAGFTMLNQNKGGAGCGRRLTCSDEYLIEQSKKYRLKMEWELANRNEYREAKRRGLIGSAITHLPHWAPTSVETRAKVSAKLKNRVFTDEHRRKISASLKGRKMLWLNKAHAA